MHNAAYQESGNVDRALPLYEQAYRIYSEVGRRRHPGARRPPPRDDLPSALCALTQRCPPAWGQAYGEDYPSTMVARANLAVAYRLARKYDRSQLLWVAQAERHSQRLADATLDAAVWHSCPNAPARGAASKNNR